jgi:hypothetical protein
MKNVKSLKIFKILIYIGVAAATNVTNHVGVTIE